MGIHANVWLAYDDQYSERNIFRGSGRTVGCVCGLAVGLERFSGLVGGRIVRLHIGGYICKFIFLCPLMWQPYKN